MKTKLLLTAALIAVLALPAMAARSYPEISGDYLEVRTCDIYTGPCFANAELGLTGKECIMVWSVKEGAWNGTALNGLKVIAVVHANNTLGNLRQNANKGQAVLIVDQQANPQQTKALTAMARELSGSLIASVKETRVAPIKATLGECNKSGCAAVQAGTLVNIRTRCLGDQDHLCGNEETYYPPLTPVTGATPAYTEVAAFTGKALNLTWQSADARSAFIGTFSR